MDRLGREEAPALDPARLAFPVVTLPLVERVVLPRWIHVDYVVAPDNHRVFRAVDGLFDRSLRNREGQSHRVVWVHASYPSVASVPTESSDLTIHRADCLRRLHPLRNPDIEVTGPFYRQVYTTFIRDMTVQVGPGRCSVEQQVYPESTVAIVQDVFPEVVYGSRLVAGAAVHQPPSSTVPEVVWYPPTCERAYVSFGYAIRSCR